MFHEENTKYNRILSIYTKLISGEVVDKDKAADEHQVDKRTIQRDIAAIRNFIENDFDSGMNKEVVFDRSRNGYVLRDKESDFLTNSEILAVCKILLESRSLSKAEMMPILNKLVEKCVPVQSKKKVSALIENEKFHYIEPKHGTNFVEQLWDIGTAIQEHRIIEITYTRMKYHKTVTRRLKPAAIMVSEYYFYLTAFIDDNKLQEHFEQPNDLFPTLYRIDRIDELKITDERFYVPYADKFEEGEFRKRVQFMYGGKLQKIKFTYKGESIEAVLDRLPTAHVLSEEDGVYTVEAEVFGKGIDMWLRSQGEKVTVLEGTETMK